MTAIRANWLRLSAACCAAVLCLAARQAAAQEGVPVGVGERVFAYWDADGYWYPAITEQFSGDEVLVRYTDNVTAWKPPGEVGRFDVQVGQHVEGDWLKRGSFYEGTVARLDGERIMIRYDDGDVEETSVAYLRLQLFHAQGLARGQKVFARWKPDGYWYPANIHRAENGYWLVRYEDRTWEWLKPADISTYVAEPGDRVEINWQGKGLYYWAQVVSRRGKELRVEFDNGQVADGYASQVRARLSP